LPSVIRSNKGEANQKDLFNHRSENERKQKQK
jgi:hypothetical protein